MNKEDIEHMWKVASNDPNHDTNWHDPIVVDFANLVAKHALANIDPSSFMTWQEGYAAGKQTERKPLTENEIKHLWYEACQTNLELTSQLIVHLARNIEAAHGIKGLV